MKQIACLEVQTQFPRVTHQANMYRPTNLNTTCGSHGSNLQRNGSYGQPGWLHIR